MASGAFVWRDGRRGEKGGCGEGARDKAHRRIYVSEFAPSHSAANGCESHVLSTSTVKLVSDAAIASLPLCLFNSEDDVSYSRSRAELEA